MKTNKQILEEASHLIRTRGLMKGRFGRDPGPYCAMGAIYKVATGSPRTPLYPKEDPPAIVLFDAAWYESTGFWGVASSFNDAPKTTADEVADALWLVAQVCE